MANRPRLRVENTTGNGWQTKIFIDDVDVSTCFNNVRVTAGLKDAVVVELDAIMAECIVDGHLQVKMPVDGTRELLIKHGWTPPSDDHWVD